LMGGKFRDDIRVYADCEVSPGMNMAEVKAVVDEVLEAGFTALKVDLDIRAYGHTGSETGWYDKDKFNMTPNKWEHDRMVQLAEMVVKAAGNDVDVATDLHTHLRRRKSLSPPRLPQAPRDAGRRHHHARYPQMRRPLRMPQDRRDG